ncbi:MAG: redoxin domain-containing protein [Planctomycetaceae bacterium]|nr:redoxin domain-containing protein [Planctomycetaceae bacterium]
MSKSKLKAVAAESSHGKEAYERSLATKTFLAMLAGFAVLYGVVLTYHVRHPLSQTTAEEPDFLELCRQYCAQYGLVPTGDIKVDAEAYLTAVNSQQLSAPLQELFADDGFQPAATEDHPLLGQPAPDFELTNTQDVTQSLAKFRQHGPVILVLYYGYNCSHCVAQLFALQKDLELFHELGAEVVAISSDSPEFTRKQYAEYGEFTFLVLSDPDLAVAETWGVYVRPTDDQQEDMLHGTFVIDRDGRVVFVNRGYEPFVDNRSLLHWLSNPTADSASGTQKVDEATSPGQPLR